MAKKIRIRRDTAANWTEANPTLALGEFGYETDTESTVDAVKYYRMKVGNGEDAWNDLPYAGWGTPASVDGGGSGPVAWADITGKPNEFPPSPHTHSWDSISGKPTEFPPSSHGHSWSDISSKPTEFPPSSHGHTWDEVSEKPTQFPPSAHGHSMAAISDYAENVDHSAGASVVGFSAGMTTNVCRYTRIGKLCTVIVEFLGTSNSTALTFTLPFAPAHNQFFLGFLVTNNGTASANPGRLSLTAGDTNAVATLSRLGTAWTPSGQKYFVGVFTYLIQ